MSESPARRERAARLRDYFDLQLRFAAAVAERSGRPLPETVTVYTNLHRRFGLGLLPRDGVPRAPLWRRYAGGLAGCADHTARLSWTLTCFRAGADEPPPPGQRRFGCFACNAPDGAGVVRIHFTNRDADGTSPLAAVKVARRRDELGALFTWVAATFPDATSVRGTSWLYHLEAYRRLFPPAYTGSRRPPETPLHFHGSSSWGQFLDHRERVKAVPRAAFLANLARLEPGRLRETFPLPALQVGAPLALFYQHYRIAPPRGGAV